MPTISDIATEARDIVDADSNSYSDSDLRRRINAAYEEVVGDILGYDGVYQFDDSNYTDFPIATTDLVASQHDYAFDDTFLEVLRIEIKNDDGDWQKVDHIDRYEEQLPLEEQYEDDGQPRYFDVQSGSVFLYPAPDSSDVTLSSGMRVFFQRTADTFSSSEFSTGTKKPGFPSPYHYLLSYKAALPYAMKYKPNRIQPILTLIQDLEEGLANHFSRRNYEGRNRMGMKNNVNRAK